jgi:hypothetical protein
MVVGDISYIVRTSIAQRLKLLLGVLPGFKNFGDVHEVPLQYKGLKLQIFLSFFHWISNQCIYT